MFLSSALEEAKTLSQSLFISEKMGSPFTSDWASHTKTTPEQNKVTY